MAVLHLHVQRGAAPGRSAPDEGVQGSEPLAGWDCTGYLQEFFFLRAE